VRHRLAGRGDGRGGERAAAGRSPPKIVAAPPPPCLLFAPPPHLDDDGVLPVGEGALLDLRVEVVPPAVGCRVRGGRGGAHACGRVRDCCEGWCRGNGGREPPLCLCPLCLSLPEPPRDTHRRRQLLPLRPLMRSATTLHFCGPCASTSCCSRASSCVFWGGEGEGGRREWVGAVLWAKGALRDLVVHGAPRPLHTTSAAPRASKPPSSSHPCPRMTTAWCRAGARARERGSGVLCGSCRD
jgi:hypothetical protein